MQSAPAWTDLRSRCPVRELKDRDMDDRRDDEGADHRFFLRFRGFRLGGTPSNASTKIFVACVVAAAAWRLVCETAWLRTVLAAVLNELSHMLMNGFFLSQGLDIRVSQAVLQVRPCDDGLASTEPVEHRRRVRRLAPLARRDERRPVRRCPACFSIALATRHYIGQDALRGQRSFAA